MFSTPVPRREKILCIVFKFLGDVVVSIPALRALRQARPDAEIHLLVADDAAALVANLPWLDRIWILPRTRGRARLRDAWPVVRALRRERFDLSVDFVGNDRGAFLSFSAGARRKIGVKAPAGFLGRSRVYDLAVTEAPADWHESKRHLNLLSELGVPSTANLDLEIRADPVQASEAAKIFPDRGIIAHVSTSKPLKEWPIENWAALAELAQRDRFKIVFSAGPSAREQAVLKQLSVLAGQVECLPPIADLAIYLAVISRAQLLVSGDTGPMHFAAGLGVPTLSLFGPSLFHQWAPIAPRARYLRAANCRCRAEQEDCTASVRCLAQLQPEVVWQEIRSMLDTKVDLPLSLPS